MIISQDRIDKAVAELARMTHGELERQTALQWGARALAAYDLSISTSELAEALIHFAEAEDYYRESIEHAASGTHASDLLRALKDQLDPAREEAIRQMS